ncbi:MAG: RNA 2',3'-cyclic phosphodiesterase [Chloroflexi bacterium]|nr:RNA 2',3'-cyclic phosphodiesterase [Chloroflexota bacterium]
MEQIRTFVAIELDNTLKDILRQVQEELKRAAIARIGRWVAPDGIHLTLKFLGNISPERVPEITQAIERGCHSFAPFTISLSQPGFFPNARRLRVVWVGVDGEVETLLQLQRSVESALNAIGFPPEKRGFQPHLTLARIRDYARPNEREEMAKRIAAVQVDTSASMLVREVHLIRSDLRPTGAVYTRLSTVPLG